jgi:hypothetical protein
MSAQRPPRPPFPFPSQVLGPSSNHYSLLPTARLVAASIGDLERGKSDLFARHSLTDIVSPGRALQTLQDPSYAALQDPSYASPNSGGTIEQPERWRDNRALARTTRPIENRRDCHETGETFSRPHDSRERPRPSARNSRLVCNTEVRGRLHRSRCTSGRRVAKPLSQADTARICEI